MHMQNHVIVAAQRKPEDVVRGRLCHVLAREPLPQPGARPFGGVGGRLPGRLRVGYLALLQPGERVAQHPSGWQHVPEVLLIVQVGDPAGGEFVPGVAHRAHVRFLERRPPRRRPRVGDAPGVDRPLHLALGHADVVRAAHRRERPGAAGKAARQFLHLADLTPVAAARLVVLGFDVLVGRRVGHRSVDDVRVAPGAEHVELALARGRIREPRGHAPLDRGPVAHGQLQAGPGQQRRAQHGLENVGYPFTKRRNDGVPPYHCLSYFGGTGVGVAREIVNLGAVAAGTPCRSTACENQRTSNAMILVICQARKAAELRNRRRPQVVGALNDFRNVGRDFIWIFLREG